MSVINCCAQTNQPTSAMTSLLHGKAVAKEIHLQGTAREERKPLEANSIRWKGMLQRKRGIEDTAPRVFHSADVARTCAQQALQCASRTFPALMKTPTRPFSFASISLPQHHRLLLYPVVGSLQERQILNGEVRLLHLVLFIPVRNS